MPYRNIWLVGRGLGNAGESAYLDEMEGFLALPIDSRPYREIEQLIGRIYSQTSGRLAMFAQLLLPGLKASTQVVTQNRASIRCLRVLNALQVHGSAGSTEVPTLVELGLLTEATTDPFTGEPLHVKKTPQGWLVYSVGRNFTDDGGKLDDNSGRWRRPAARSQAG